MSDKNYSLVGACGLYCGACDHYRAFAGGSEHLLKRDKFKVENIDEVSCRGCHSDKLTKHCNECKMRLCAKSKDILHCGLCSDYPCDLIKTFHSDGYRWEGAKHRGDIFKNIEELKKSSADRWLEVQNETWSCKKCGYKFTFYEKECHKCGETLDSYANK